MTRDTGGPAYPHVGAYVRQQLRNQSGDDFTLIAQERATGMTLRDYFAAKAMQGLIAQSRGNALHSDHKLGAEYAYQMADAMLAKRAKP